MTPVADFKVGSLAVRGSERVIAGPSGSCTVEPLVMQLLLHLAGEAGRVVSRRDLFRMLWGSSTVGEDSLNRLVAALRKALDVTGAEQMLIGTVPGSGYVLQLAPAAIMDTPPNSLPRRMLAGGPVTRAWITVSSNGFASALNAILEQSLPLQFCQHRSFVLIEKSEPLPIGAPTQLVVGLNSHW